MLKLYPALILAVFLLFGCGIFNSDDKDPVYTCNGIEYAPPYQTCEGGIVKIQCGDDYYNPAMQFCSEQDNLVYDKCGGIDYNTEKQECENARVYDLCGTSKVNPGIEGCCNGMAKFILTTQFCYGSVEVHDKCDGKEYTPYTQICEDGILKEYCGNIWHKEQEIYNPGTQFCNRGIIIDKCNGAAYNPLYQKCENNIVLVKCEDCISNIVMAETFVDERDGITYKSVQIGTQVWMAENLNYNAVGSVCYDEEESNCATYGSLYNWAMAMALPSNCNSSSCASQINAKHRGICPAGWHIPSNDEWNVLIHYVGGDSVAGAFLKTTSGWADGINGIDKHGFAALPSGSFDASEHDFCDVGYNSYWWSSTETFIGNTAYYCTFNDDGMACFDRKSYRNTSYMFSIRCIKD